MKRYKVVAHRQIFSEHREENNTPERQLEDFLNREAKEGWHYRDIIAPPAPDLGSGIGFVVLESEEDLY